MPKTDAEIERTREIEEEHEYRRAVVSDALPSIEGAFAVHTSKLIRDYVRSVLSPPLLKRMYDTAMGVEKFDTPTAMGNVVRVEASPVVQMATARALVQIGVPAQLGLTDGDGNVLPGVIALGPLEMDAARRESHGERYVPAEDHARLMAQHTAHDPHAPERNAQPASLRPMAERIAAGEFEVTEVDEGVGVTITESNDKAPPPLVEVMTPEKKVLANRHAKKLKLPLPYPEVSQ
jgi:hypothetical protein